MKKIFLVALMVLSSVFVFAESYKITDSEFNVRGAGGLSFGKTTKTALLMKCPIDTYTVFKSKEQLEEYIDNYKQTLKNTRAFETIDIRYDIDHNEEADLYNIKLYFDLQDSSHLLALPYPKYSSNDGFTLKLKVKDNNFLGSLNPLSSDLSFNYDRDSKKWNFGISFDYDYPFKAGIFNATWANSLSVNYTTGNNKPSFSTKTGVGFSLPKEFFSINFGAYQVVGYNTKNFYFRELLDFSIPITLFKAKNYSTVSYTPYVNLSFDWDKNFIDSKKPFKDGLDLTFGHSISNSKVDYDNSFRKGYSLSFANNFSYNFDTNYIVPNFEVEGKFFNNFDLFNTKGFLNHFGLNSRIYAFTVVDVPTSGAGGNFYVGSRMRGIIDRKFPGSPCGVVVNLDMPINVLTTHFSNNLFNFTMQISPFIDIALTNDSKEATFNLNRRDLSAGCEVLVYPKRFSSYTIRGSVGVDIKKALKAKEGIVRGVWHNKEIYIGLDLHY